MSALRILLVVNPGARGVTPAVIAATVAQWSAAGPLDVVRSRARRLEGLVPLAAKAEAVVVLGGDGVLNQVANVLVDMGSDAAVVPLPAGTTNVVARNLGLPRHLGAASETAMAALREGHTARRGWGRLNGRGFLANAGIGLDAAVVARTEAHLRAKRRLGHIMFGAAALGELRPGRRPPPLTVTGQGPDVAGCHQSMFWVLALADHPYSYAGPRPLRVLGTADLPDTGPTGSLTLLCFEPTDVRGLAGLAGRALFGRDGVTTKPGVQRCRVTTSVGVTSPTAVAAQTDGEPLSPSAHFEFRYQPDTIRLIQPASLEQPRAAGPLPRRLLRHRAHPGAQVGVRTGTDGAQAAHLSANPPFP